MLKYVVIATMLSNEAACDGKLKQTPRGLVSMQNAPNMAIIDPYIRMGKAMNPAFAVFN